MPSQLEFSQFKKPSLTKIGDDEMALVNTVEYIWNNKEEGATSIAVELNLLLEKL